jgi:uncharacterized protein
MEIRPAGAGGRPYIERYGPGGFKIGGAVFTGAVIILPSRAEAWPVAALAEATPESFRPVAEHGAIEILLIGSGKRMERVSPALRQALREIGIVIDAMDTGAACRTYNVLASEGRRVAAALLPLRG